MINSYLDLKKFLKSIEREDVTISSWSEISKTVRINGTTICLPKTENRIKRLINQKVNK